MKIKSMFIFMFMLVIIAGCTQQKTVEVTYHIESTPGGNFQATVNDYFRNFDNIRYWRQYATDSFIKKVYAWCTEDYSEEKTLDEMVDIYYEVNKESLILKAVAINEIEITENEEVILSVTRTWENDESSEASYLFKYENNEWKIDDKL
ncbi:hypothetical protein ACX93W_21980 [Paenibacillus sp. CAU 1782]